MKKLTFNLLFFLVYIPIKIIDIYLIETQKINLFFSYPLESIIYNIDDILMFSTLWAYPLLTFLILLTIWLFRFKYIWMSRWYSLALLAPIWNLYLIYKLVSSNDNKINENKNNDIIDKNLKEESIKQNINIDKVINIIRLIIIITYIIMTLIIISMEFLNIMVAYKYDSIFLIIWLLLWLLYIYNLYKYSMS